MTAILPNYSQMETTRRYQRGRSVTLAELREAKIDKAFLGDKYGLLLPHLPHLESRLRPLEESFVICHDRRAYEHPDIWRNAVADAKLTDTSCLRLTPTGLTLGDEEQVAAEDIVILLTEKGKWVTVRHATAVHYVVETHESPSQFCEWLQKVVVKRGYVSPEQVAVPYPVQAALFFDPVFADEKAVTNPVRGDDWDGDRRMALSLNDRIVGLGGSPPVAA